MEKFSDLNEGDYSGSKAKATCGGDVVIKRVRREDKPHSAIWRRMVDRKKNRYFKNIGL
jgi:hypothetical protein